MKRKQQRRSIERRIQFFAAGRVVKTVRQKISLNQSIREIGADRIFTKGDSVTIRRRIGRCCRVIVTWTAVESLCGTDVCTVRMNTTEARDVIRRNMIL